jgi:hypothetical protein
MSNANSTRTNGLLTKNKGWLKKERTARREETREKHNRVWLHTSLHQRKLIRAYKAGVDTQKTLKDKAQKPCG